MSETILVVIAIALQIVCLFLGYLYLSHWGEEGLTVHRFFGLHLHVRALITILITSAMSFFVFCYGYILGDDAYIRALVNALVFVWLVVAGYVDAVDRIIPNHLIGLGLILWLAVEAIDIFVAGTPLKNVAVYSLIGGLVCGGLLLLIALITRGALGMGDVKLFTVLGLLYGLMDTYSVLLFSVLLMGVVSIVLLILKKVTTKTAVPMAPFVAVGFFFSILAGM